MKKTLLFVLSVVGIAFFLGGCASTQIQPDFSPQDLSGLKAQGYMQKAENLYVVFDGSASMADFHKGYEKLAYAKEVTRRMNATVPDIPLDAGLRVFGPLMKAGRDNNLVYGLTKYNRDDFINSLKPLVIPGGMTPMANAIDASNVDLQAAKDRIAMVVIGDGEQTGRADSLEAANNMKRAFGDRICISTIQIGNSPSGGQLLQDIVKAGGCGYAVNADDIMTGEGMANFVQKILFEVVGDSDGDGVPDNRDKCPNTPRGTKVDMDGCPIPVPKVVEDNDSDKDGVVNDMDKCPNTPMGAKVDGGGCWTIENVLFDYDKSYIRGSEYTKLEPVYDVLMMNPDVMLQLDGHADVRADEQYNMALSQKRANAVKDYFTGMGVDASRFSTKAYGKSKPVAMGTSEGEHQRNRRVEMQPNRR